MDHIFELDISLPDKDSRQLLEQLHRQLHAAILDGRLKAGFRLPPTREFSKSLGISRNTVVAAYDLLLSEGYLSGRTGSGTFVSDIRGNTPKKPVKQANYADKLAPFWRNTPKPRTAAAAVKIQFDFRFGYPDIRHFPHHVWRRLSDRALRNATRSGVVHASPEGLPMLREAIVKHVSFSRAVACEPDDIVVTNGSQQAFALLAQILVVPGRTVIAVEDPGYRPARAVFEAAGAKLIPVPVDVAGMVTSKLPRKADIVYTTPTHQSPLGVTMSAARRAELLAYAQACGAVIIEDDYDSEYRFAGRPLDALQTLDRIGCVFYVGTFTKSLLPSLKLGFMVAPSWAWPALTEAKRLQDGQCAALLQETLAAFILEGHLARYVRKMRGIYAGRNQATLDALHRHCAKWLEPLPSSAGLHVAALFKQPMDAARIVAEAAAVNIAIEDLDRFAMSANGQCGLAFGFGNIDAARIGEGVARLANILQAAG
jgi:GntR family transcriptional regulator / MocR family aminotransferase